MALHGDHSLAAGDIKPKNKPKSKPIHPLIQKFMDAIGFGPIVNAKKKRDKKIKEGGG